MSTARILSVEYLGYQQSSAEFANTGQLCQRCDFGPIWKWRRGIEKGITTFRLEGLDLVQNQVEPLKLTADLCLDIATQGPPIAGLKTIEL